jgi:thymidylate kinase
MNPVIVTIDGLPGTGKSTAAMRLAAALQAETIAVPPSDLREVSVWFAGNAHRHPSVSGAFFAAALGLALVRAEDCRAAGRAVVLDRYLWSTFAHLAILGANLDQLVALLPNVRVDLRVLLTCSEATRARRIVTRRTPHILAERLRDPALLQNTVELQRAFAFDLVLDTDRLSVEAVVDAVIDAVERRWKGSIDGRC